MLVSSQYSEETVVGSIGYKLMTIVSGLTYLSRTVLLLIVYCLVPILWSTTFSFSQIIVIQELLSWGIIESCTVKVLDDYVF